MKAFIYKCHPQGVTPFYILLPVHYDGIFLGSFLVEDLFCFIL